MGKLVTGLILIVSAISTAMAQSGTYTAERASNVREQPSVNSPVVAVLERGQRVSVVGSVKSGSWYQITLPQGVGGYVYYKLLREQAPATGDRSTATSAPAGDGQRSESRPGSLVYFITPYDGESIPGGKFRIRFGLRDMGVAPAGLQKQFTGHHHLLIDVPPPPLDEAIPSDDNHVHFGRGQTEYFLELPGGEHTLQLLLGDHDHIPHDPPVMSSKITITVP